MQGARGFLEKVLPWDLAGPDVWFNIHWKDPNPEDAKRGWWGGRPCHSLDDMLKQLNYFNKDKRDFYICMSAQNRYEEKQAKATGRKYKTAMRFQANVVGLRSLFIDIDVKEGAYADTEKAYAALSLFMGALDLPEPSAVVASGSGGFHVHWVLANSVGHHEWQVLANALAGATQSLGLITDSQCTIDSVRILRIPGTKNYKTDPPNPVELKMLGDVISYEDLYASLKPYIGFTHIGKTSAGKSSSVVVFPFERRKATTEGSELSAGIVVEELPLPSIYDIAGQCPFTADAVCDGGADYNNPQWFMSLNIASFTKEGREAAHLMSFQHASYSDKDTDEQYDRIVKDHEQRDIGWPSCKKIQLTGASQCATCPLLSYNKSPLHFVSTTAAGPIKTLDDVYVPSIQEFLPDKYSRRLDGFIYTAIVDENGKSDEVPVLHYKISNGWMQSSPWVLHFTAVSSSGTGKEYQIEIPVTEFGAMGGCRKTLAGYGIVLTDKEFKATEAFLVAWSQKLQHYKEAVHTAVPFGWNFDDDNKIVGFTYAGMVWGKGDPKPSSGSDKAIKEIYTPCGSLEYWRETVKIVTERKSPGLNLMLASSFGAPLIRFVGQSGGIMAGFSNESGVGKSTAFSCGLAVWGHPKLSKNGLNDTSNSLMGKLAKIRALPIYWDEIQSDEDKDIFVKNVFPVSTGKNKNRSHRDGSMRSVEGWDSLMISATNGSLTDVILKKAVTHNAGLMRMFEFKIPKLDMTTSIGNASRAIKGLEENYGKAGIVYSRFLGANYDRVEKDVAVLQDQVNKRYNAGQDERIWTSLITCAMQGALYAVELGLIEFDMEAMWGFVDAAFYHMRQTAHTSPNNMADKENVSTTFQQFMNKMHSRNTLVTNKVTTGAGRPMPGSIKVIGDVSRLEALFVQKGLDDGIIRISGKALDTWINDNKLPRYEMLEAFKKIFKAKSVNGFLGGGTSFKTDLKEHLWEINTSDFPELWREEITTT